MEEVKERQGIMMSISENASPLIKEAYAKISQEVKDEIMGRVWRHWGDGFSRTIMIATAMWFNCKFGNEAAHAYLCVVKRFFSRKINIERNMALIEMAA